jgi:hypothetical protein
VCGQGEDVRGALDKMVREDRVVQKILAEHRPASPLPSPAAPTGDDPDSDGGR